MSKEYIFNIINGKPRLENVKLNGYFEVCLVKQSERVIEHYLNEHGGDLCRHIMKSRDYKSVTVFAKMDDQADGWFVSSIRIQCTNQDKDRQENLRICGGYQVSYEIARGDSNE